MSAYWNSRIKNLSPYVPGEQPKDRQFIKLNTNENPYPPSPKVINALQKAVNDSLRLYPDPECTVFRKAIAAHCRVRIEQVFAGNGSDEILAFAFGAFFESSAAGGAAVGAVGGAKPILFPDITYSFYPVYARFWNIPYRTIPLNDNFFINTAEYKIPSGGAVFPNPNAPTGIALPLRDVLSLAEYLEKSKNVFILDEAYTGFGADSAVPHIKDHPNMLCVYTLSKSGSLAGLRAGFAVGSEELIDGLRRVRDSFNSYTLDRLALAGATAALSDAAYYNDINSRVARTRKRVTETLRSMGFTVLPSAANFIFMKCNLSGINGAGFFSALREKGILVRHFDKERISDFLRVSMGTDDDMDVFLGACGEIISHLK
jgi:histidinol-phosphate aminotransferase